MSVDKFGRHESFKVREVIRGPPGKGFLLTHDGHYDLKGKRLCNIADPIREEDAVRLGTIRLLTLNCKDNENIFDAKNKRIINVAKAERDTDAVNRIFVLREINRLKQDIYDKIGKLSTKMMSFHRSNKEEITTSENNELTIYNKNHKSDKTLLRSNELIL